MLLDLELFVILDLAFDNLDATTARLGHIDVNMRARARSITVSRH